MKKWWIGFLINIQFFTAIPIKKALPMEKEYISVSVKTFPLLGLFQGFIYVGVLWLLTEYTPFSSLSIAFFVWLSMILVTGGLHLDGWMDSSDAFFSYQSKEKRLEIMKDPHIGAFGVLSCIVLLSMKFLFVYEVIVRAQTDTYLMILFLPFLSKTIMGLLLIYVKEAKTDGLGAFFKKSVTGNIGIFYSFYFFICFGVIFLLHPSMLGIFTFFVIVGLGCFLFFSKMIRKHFGGMTGDLLGASVEGAELILWTTIWLLHYFVMV